MTEPTITRAEWVARLDALIERRKAGETLDALWPELQAWADLGNPIKERDIPDQVVFFYGEMRATGRITEDGI